MQDKTVVARVLRQRRQRIAEGWLEVRVWVPTAEDARDVRNLAAERRAKAEALDGLSQEVTNVNIETELRIAKAIAEHGSKAFNTPSGAVLELMTELSGEDGLVGFARAFIILARAKPSNAAFVAGQVPAKICNFLIRHRGIDSATFVNWSRKNPDWTESLKDAVRDPTRFERTVEDMATAIKATQH